MHAIDARHLLAASADRFAGATALIHGEEHYSYGWLNDQADLLATGISAAMDEGELLAIWMPNCPELICLYLACLRCGVLPMPLHRDMPWPEVQRALKHAHARTLVASAALLAPTLDLSGTGLESVFVHGRFNHAPVRRPWAELTAAVGAQHRPPARDDVAAFVLHTSGSQGQPKGVVLSVGNLNQILELRLGHTGLTRNSVTVMASCLTQSVGLHQTLAMLAAGGTIVLLADYAVDAMAAAVNRYRPTHLMMAVGAFDNLLRHPAIGPDSLSHIIFASAGADRVTPGLQERYMKLTGHPLRVSYGLSESSWAILNLSGRADKCLALGKAAPGASIRLVDDNGVIEGSHVVGEIQICSPRTMTGYLHAPELTTTSIVDGWLSSGDLAYRDDEGFFWFAGRKKDVIVLSSGDNVWPAEVEQALLRHSKVRQCLVTRGVADNGSEVPVAYVVCDPEICSEADIFSHLDGLLSPHKWPVTVYFVAQLPNGPTGKLLRSPGTGASRV